MQLESRIRLLGFYLIFCSIYQGTVFLFTDTHPFINPRLGLVLLGSIRSISTMEWLYWTTVVWLLCLGAAVSIRPKWFLLLVFYLVLDTVSAVPTLFYILLSASVDMGHMSAGPVGIAVLTASLLVFDIVPFAITIHLLRRKRLSQLQAK